MSFESFGRSSGSELQMDGAATENARHASEVQETSAHVL